MERLIGISILMFGYIGCVAGFLSGTFRLAAKHKDEHPFRRFPKCL